MRDLGCIAWRSAGLLAHVEIPTDEEIWLVLVVYVHFPPVRPLQSASSSAFSRFSSDSCWACFSSLHIRLRPAHKLLQPQQIHRHLHIILQILLRIHIHLAHIRLMLLDVQPDRRTA